MRTCGLIVEYNPFHNGHAYHLEQSIHKTNADVTIAVMSGNFLQRGEPAITDKFSRTRAALTSGVDLVVELPHVYACQYADLFSKGAIATLDALGVEQVCFGSESGNIQPFLDGYNKWSTGKAVFEKTLKEALKSGSSFPQASREAYRKLNLTSENFDLSQPNNILGFSYVKAIKELNANIEPVTVRRTKSHYHDEEIEYSIASATSIRKELFNQHLMTTHAKQAMPQSTVNELETYLQTAGRWHEWEGYFSLLRYIVQVTPIEGLQQIHGVIEGLEYRLKETADKVNYFHEWLERLKTKRYTYTRVQRVFVHLLTQLKAEDMLKARETDQVPYVRILGMNEQGRSFINKQKKKMTVPLISNLQQMTHEFLTIEERATNAYYAVIEPEIARKLKKQELTGPILL
ncbi:nucleotidyltransferase [Allobacillus sp. GCM10007491]|uniref:tRNA(Met) cytidine acetate ligase n=1 Tax=Allobacillus saliphilus TaxID=2912308 RepID=A0A941CRW2_9BACI|nr:nucleotidyltransferase [Allobacillus saliphilus]MBR7552782.1 nucleotidyltransferase [Allobacillus saliphilus]